MKRQRATKNLVDTAVKPHSNAELYNAIGKTATKLGTTVAGLAEEAQNKSDLATMNESMSEANIQAMEFTQAWRVDNEANPRNPEALAKYDQGMRKIYGKYSDGISMQNKGKWSELSSKLVGRTKEQNVEWGFKQDIVNAETSINKSRENNLVMAAQLGSIGDIEKSLELYKDSREGLLAFGQGIFSKEKLNEMLDDYEADFMESMLGGMLETFPEKARELLSRQDVKDALQSTDREKTLSDLAEKKEIEMDDAFYEVQIENESVMTDVLFDPQLSSVEQMTQLNMKERSQEISKEYAELGRLLLKSKKSLKALPNTPEETELIILGASLKQQLGSNPSTKESKAFLKKKREFNNLALKYQTAGKVTKTSANKILNKLNDSLSKATGGIAKAGGKWIIYDDADAYKSFKNDLGDSIYQGEAIREYFYSTDGVKMTGEDKKTVADNIIQKMKDKSLTKASTAIITPKRTTKQYSQTDLEYTAKQHNITVAEVKKRLGIK